MPFGIIEIFQIVALEIQDGSVVIIIIIVTTVNIGLKMILFLTPVNLKNVYFPSGNSPLFTISPECRPKTPSMWYFHAGLDETVLFGKRFLALHPSGGVRMQRVCTCITKITLIVTVVSLCWGVVYPDDEIPVGGPHIVFQIQLRFSPMVAMVPLCPYCGVKEVEFIVPVQNPVRIGDRCLPEKGRTCYHGDSD